MDCRTDTVFNMLSNNSVFGLLDHGRHRNVDSQTRWLLNVTYSDTSSAVHFSNTNSQFSKAACQYLFYTISLSLFLVFTSEILYSNNSRRHGLCDGTTRPWQSGMEATIISECLIEEVWSNNIINPWNGDTFSFLTAHLTLSLVLSRLDPVAVPRACGILWSRLIM